MCYMHVVLVLLYFYLSVLLLMCVWFCLFRSRGKASLSAANTGGRLTSQNSVGISLSLTYPHTAKPYSIILPIWFFPFFPTLLLSCHSHTFSAISPSPNLLLSHPPRCFSLCLQWGGVDSAESCCDRGREGEWSLWHFNGGGVGEHETELLHLGRDPIWQLTVEGSQAEREAGRQTRSLPPTRDWARALARTCFHYLTGYYTSHCVSCCSLSLLIIVFRWQYLICYWT